MRGAPLEDEFVSYEKLKATQSVTVGMKQSVKLIEEGQAVEVFIASDAEKQILNRISSLCNKMGVRVTYVDSMKQLGKACGIEVGAAVVAIRQE
jgi:large subunit ribosomal protein L7A